MICGLCNLEWASRSIVCRNFKVFVRISLCDYCHSYRLPAFNKILEQKGFVIDNNLQQLKQSQPEVSQ